VSGLAVGPHGQTSIGEDENDDGDDEKKDVTFIVER
jgi:hypothetical protein